MEATEPVSMDETMEILDDQNYALESTSPDDGRLTQAKGVPSLAMPVGSRAESAIVDSLSSSSYAEDWLKSLDKSGEYDQAINQGKLRLWAVRQVSGSNHGCGLPEALGVPAYGLGALSAGRGSWFTKISGNHGREVT